MSENTSVVISEGHAAPTGLAVFADLQSFETAQRMALALAKSDLVPTQYRDNVANCLIALDYALRFKSNPLMVMQNLNIINGRPSWSSAFIIAAINSCGRFEALQFNLGGEGDDRACYAWTTDRRANRLEGPPVSIQMAKDEKWFGRSGSKWQTMPDLMLRYRAAAFFGRLYAPDILMGLYTADEVQDFAPSVSGQVTVDRIIEGSLADSAVEA